MSQPVKLSDPLVLDARLAGKYCRRSIAGQVEFWAGIGRAIEPLIRGDKVMALSRNSLARPLSACLESVDTDAGRKRLKAILDQQPFPRYEAAAGKPGMLVRIDSNGKRTVGRFVNRVFRPGAPVTSKR